MNGSSRTFGVAVTNIHASKDISDLQKVIIEDVNVRVYLLNQKAMTN